MRLPRLASVAAGAALLAALAVRAGTAATPTQTFVYATPTQVMVGWDPATSYSNEIIAMSNVYETLTHYDPVTKRAKPALATRFSSNKEGTAWTFVLRRGVTFHTGRPLTAQAAKAAIERTMKLHQGAAYVWDSVKSISTPNASTLVFHLKYAAPLDLIAAADYAAYIYDVHAAPASKLAAWFNQGRDAGTGPFTVDFWHKGQEVELRLKAYPRYWAGWTEPHYRAIEYWVVPSVTTMAQLARAGNVTFTEQLNPQLWESFKSSTSVSTTSSPSWQNLLALLNTKSGPLADRRIRQAISYAVDYKGLIAAMTGSATRQIGVVPPGLWGHFDSLPGQYDTNPSKAKALLQAAGYGPGGKKLTLTLTNTQGVAYEELFATLLKSNLAALNVDLRIRTMAWPTQWAKAKSSDPAQRQDIFLFVWWPDYADPYSWFVNLFKTEKQPFYNLAYYSNPKLDALMRQAERSAASQRDKAVQLYKTMQSMLLHDAPVIPAFVTVYQRTLAKGVSGYVDNPAYPNVVYAYDLRPPA
ncbi:MAG TPA: ABC transporter substrate-binding protein [Gaiellaceae bacterium]|nr:ABC transporter substrate-binding protein [Gaiellaceae bacterium]